MLQIKSVNCWNHILQDVKNWLQKKGTSEDKVAYRTYVTDLLNCKKEVEYEELVAIFKTKCSIPFLYYETFLEEDVVKSVQWQLHEVGI